MLLPSMTSATSEETCEKQPRRERFTCVCACDPAQDTPGPSEGTWSAHTVCAESFSIPGTVKLAVRCGVQAEVPVR